MRANSITVQQLHAAPNVKLLTTLLKTNDKELDKMKAKDLKLEEIIETLKGKDVNVEQWIEVSETKGIEIAQLVEEVKAKQYELMRISEAKNVEYEQFTGKYCWLKGLLKDEDYSIRELKLHLHYKNITVTELNEDNNLQK